MKSCSGFIYFFARCPSYLVSTRKQHSVQTGTYRNQSTDLRSKSKLICFCMMLVFMKDTLEQALIIISKHFPINDTGHISCIFSQQGHLLIVQKLITMQFSLFNVSLLFETLNNTSGFKKERGEIQNSNSKINMTLKHLSNFGVDVTLLKARF